jgi:hypothetical protein
LDISALLKISVPNKTAVVHFPEEANLKFLLQNYTYALLALEPTATKVG